MPDYNLGRAHGEIIITADTSGADRAAASMAATSAEGETLEQTLGKVRKELAESDRQYNLVNAQLQRQKDKVADLKRTYANYHDDLQKATARTLEAERKLSELRKQADQLPKGSVEWVQVINRQNAALLELNKARERQLPIIAAERAAHTKLLGEQDKLTTKTRELHQRLKELDRMFNSNNASKLTRNLLEAGRAADKLASILSGTLLTAFKAIGMIGGVGILGGLIGLLGGGAMNAIVAATTGAAQGIMNLSGALIALPAIITGVVFAFGTLKTAFSGVGQALKDAEDPKKFAEDLRKLAPAAQEVVKILASYRDAFRGAKMQVQQSLFGPMVNDIQGLIRTWLPALMQGAKMVANMFGQMGHEVATWLKQPESMKTFKQFIDNITAGMKAMIPAIRPILSAFATLNVVGSSVFPRISAAITNAANSFNKWIQASAASGKLKGWLDQALTSMHNVWLMAKNLGGAIASIISVASQFHGGFLLDMLVQLNNWSKSASGQNQLVNFFATLKESGDALKPVLQVVGTVLAQLAVNLVKLGTALGPGFTQFFTGFGDGLNTLGQSLIASAPALNQFLGAFGQFIAEVMDKLGPALPGLLANLSQALINLSPILLTVTDAIVNFLSSMSAEDIGAVMGLVAALKLVPPIMAAINFVMSANPIGLVIIAIGALVAAIIYVIEHFDQFKAGLSRIWEALKGFGSKLGEMATSARKWGADLINGFIQGIKDRFSGVRDAIDKVASILPDWLKPGSPTKSGPLSSESTQSMGQRLVSGFATGISDAAPLVQASTHSIAGMAASGFALSSANFAGNFLSGVGAKYGGSSGGAGRSTGGSGGGSGFISGSQGGGKSGLSQRISFIVQDMQDWIQIASQAKDLFDKVKDTIIGGIATLATVWNDGVNPLTGPDGLATKLGVGPGATGQKKVNAVPQQSIPGITNIGPNGENNPPSQVQGQQQSAAQGTLAEALAAKGFSPQQIRLIQGFSQVEGLNPAGNPTLGFTDAQLGGASDLQSHVDALAKQFKDRASVAGAFPEGGSDFDQAQWIAKVVGQAGLSSDWQGNAQPKDYIQKVVDAMQQVPVGNVQGQSPVDPFDNNPLFPGGMGAFGPAKNLQTPHVGNLPSLTDILAESGGGTTPVRAGMPGNAPTLGPWGIPAGQISGITPITDPSMVGLGQFWGGILPSTYGGHQVQGGVNRGIDWGPFKGWTNRPGQAYGGEVGAQIGTEANGSRQLTREEADRMTDFAKWISKQAGVEQVIWMNPYTGEKVGKDPGDRGANQSIENYYRDDWTGHSQHVHTRMAQKLGLPGEPGLVNNEIPMPSGGVFDSDEPPPPLVEGVPQRNAEPGQGGAWDPESGEAPPYAVPGRPDARWSPGAKAWVDQYGTFVAGVDANGYAIAIQPKPTRAGPTLPTTTLPPPPVLPSQVPAPGSLTRPAPNVLPSNTVPANLVPTPTPQEAQSQPGFTASASSVGVAGLNVAQGLPSFGAVFGDAFTLMNDFVKSISATSEISEQLVRGVSDTQDVNKLIDNFQTYITFASDIAKTVGDSASAVGSIVGAAGGADPSGGASAAATAIQAVAGVASFISGALQATNMAIDLGQAVVKQTMKYGAIFEGYLLGNAETGALGGNVRMLLNTNTGDIMAYSQDSPKNKNVINLPSWFDKAYGGTRQGPVDQRTQLNIYAGPGQTPRDMMNESMWLINTAGPSVVSVAGRD